MRFRKCSKVLLALVLVMCMTISGGLTVLAEVGPGVQSEGSGGNEMAGEASSGTIPFTQVELPVVVLPPLVASETYFPPYDFIFPDDFEEQYHVDAFAIGADVREVDEDATAAEMLRLCQVGDTNRLSVIQPGCTYVWCAKVTVPTTIDPNDPSWVIRTDTYAMRDSIDTIARADICLGGPGNIMYDVQGTFEPLHGEVKMETAHVDMEQCYVGYIDTLNMQTEEIEPAIIAERAVLSDYVKISAEVVKTIPDPTSMLYCNEHVMLHMNATVSGAGLRPGQTFYVLFKYKLD